MQNIRKMKKAIFIFGLGVLALTTANAKGSKTNEAKTTETVAAPTETKTKDASYYWYEVSYVGNTNGFIPAGATLVAHDQQSNVTAPCDAGSTRDCLRGFSSQQTAGTLSAGDAQIQTDEPK
jgi:TctA family transporter